jgi:hypothetical protein
MGNKGKVTTLHLSLPFGIGGVTIEPNDVEQRAAWSLYVELVSRIAIQPLKDDEGLLREALTSLYRLFEVTRTVLKEAGPEVGNGPESLGAIALAVLNDGLRPFLAKWHPRLKAYEDLRKPDVSQPDHERNWPEYNNLRGELVTLQGNLRDYADALGKIAGVKLPA